MILLIGEFFSIYFSLCNSFLSLMIEIHLNHRIHILTFISQLIESQDQEGPFPLVILWLSCKFSWECLSGGLSLHQSVIRHLKICCCSSQKEVVRLYSITVAIRAVTNPKLTSGVIDKAIYNKGSYSISNSCLLSKNITKTNKGFFSCPNIQLNY